MNNSTYKHTDFSGDFISLHECSANGISYENGVLSLTFNDGIRLKEKHHASRLCKNTGKARVDYAVAAAPAIFIFKKNLFGKLTKKELTVDALAELVNGNNTTLEILGTYRSDNGTLIKCWAKDKKSDKVSECHIELAPSKTTYYW